MTDGRRQTATAVENELLQSEGPDSPPHANGELVFTAPWQSRLFATTMRLYEGDHLDWPMFRAGLIAQIARHDQTISRSEDFDYWMCWQRSLEQLLDQTGLVAEPDIANTASELADRPPGHDHHHDHNHNY